LLLHYFLLQAILTIQRNILLQQKALFAENSEKQLILSAYRMKECCLVTAHLFFIATRVFLPLAFI
jgi:hypothetical protein